MIKVVNGQSTVISFYIQHRHREGRRSRNITSRYRMNPFAVKVIE